MRIIKVNKRYVGVMLGKLCGRGNLTFANLCMDSSFVLFCFCFGFFFFLCVSQHGLKGQEFEFVQQDILRVRKD